MYSPMIVKQLVAFASIVAINSETVKSEMQLQELGPRITNVWLDRSVAHVTSCMATLPPILIAGTYVYLKIICVIFLTT